MRMKLQHSFQTADKPLMLLNDGRTMICNKDKQK